MGQTNIKEIPSALLVEQQMYMRGFAELEARPHSYSIVTYGCQMNERDSETIAGMFKKMEMEEAADRESADLVIFNTCCVRDNAQRRALGNVTWLKELKKVKPELLVAVCGCMMQQKGMAEQILRQYPFVDLAFGTSNLYRLPELLYRSVKEKKRVIEVLNEPEDFIPEDLPVLRVAGSQAYVTIMYGCNNYCSYCIVPYVRGRERSRDSSRILNEVCMLKKEGRKEIMLLGQNVNSYGLDRKGELSFAQLLKHVSDTGIERIRFMTSHPKDLSDELIKVMADSPNVCHSLHLPAQHGSDRILSSMNRKYTREQYLEKVNRIRSRIPDISLSTDLIVGYPGESDEDFEELMSFVEQVRFDSAFTFIYSPRVGTRAAKMENQIPPEVSSARIQQLISLQKEITKDRLRGYVGQVHRVLVEAPSKRNVDEMSGKNEYNIMVNFPGDRSLMGQFVDVCILSANETTLRGEMV